MTIIWATVKEHNGFIDIHTEECRGSTIALYLPVTRDLPEQMEPDFSLEDCRGNERILVVDDVPEQREIAALMLRKLGYNVQTADSGEDAIEQLQGETVDILVLDMIMDPGIDGCETYRRIVAIHPSQKAIIASGFTESDWVKEAQRLVRGRISKNLTACCLSPGPSAVNWTAPSRRQRGLFPYRVSEGSCQASIKAIHSRQGE